MNTFTNQIRDLREGKNLSQDAVAEAAGLTYSQFVRVEGWAGAGRTTREEYDHVVSTIKGMEPGTRKLAGRPFADPKKQAAVEAARAEGKSVAEALGFTVPKDVSTTPLEDFTKKQLLGIAKDEGLTGVSRLSKDDLIAAIKAARENVL